MKIGFVILTDLAQLKGDAIHVKCLLREFENLGVSCDPIVCKACANPPKQKHLNLLVKMVTRFLFLQKVLAVRKRYDLLYLRDWLFACLLTFFGVRFAFEINGLLPYEGLIRDYFTPGSRACRAFEWVQRRVLHRAVAVVAVSAPIKEYCVDEVGLDPAKIVVAENAADTSVFRPDVARQDVPKAEGTVLAGWMGSFESQHGFADFVAIAKRLRERGCDNVQFLIIGGGSDKEQLEGQLAQMGLADYFVFCGRVRWDQIPGFMVNADFCLSLYRRTAQNLEYRARTGVAQIKIFEYLALGKPVLAYDHGDARAFFADRQIGWVCPLQPEAVADRIVEIAARPDQIRDYGQNALALSRERYNWAATARTIVDFLQESK